MTEPAAQAAAAPTTAALAASPTGVLLTNLGTPDAPTPAALRRYLAEFLWDPRVIEKPRWLWWLVLHGIILRIRPARAAKAYAKVWTDDGSPLLAISRAQAQALQQHLDAQAPQRFRVALAMRYGTPSIAAGLAELRAAGAQRVLVLPLYPQYSATTSASTVDAVAQTLRGQRCIPELRVINEYHQAPAYIEALAASIRRHWQDQAAAERLLFSFHGLPQRYVDAGDPYQQQCLNTARCVAEALGLSDGQWLCTFQSRFGPEAWLQPYTDVTLKELAAAGVRSVDVVCPGFAADCLETLEEIAMENRSVFLDAGGQDYRYIPALNTNDEHLDCLSQLVLQHSQGWPGG